jgi:hypothetical protein
MQSFKLFINGAIGNPNGNERMRAQHIINTCVERIDNASIINPPEQILYRTLGIVTEDFSFSVDGKEYSARKGEKVYFDVN